MTVDTQKLRGAAYSAKEFASVGVAQWPHTAKAHINGLADAVEICCEEIERKDAEVARLRDSIQRAYGYLWHVNNEPGTPNQHAPEAMAYEARKVLRDLLTSEQRGEGITAARAALSGERNG